MSFTRSRRRGRIMKKRTRRTQNKKRHARKTRMRKRWGGEDLKCSFDYNIIKQIDNSVRNEGVLGKGSFGKTFVVIETIQTDTNETQILLEHDTKQYVVKQNINKNQAYIHVAKREATILKALSVPDTHPNILKYVGCNDTDGNNFYIITEYNPGYYDLDSFIYGKIPKDSFKETQDVAKYFATKMVTQIISGFKQEIIINTCITQLYEGLYAIHSKNVFHRDIKPENIIINPETGDIKYIDFGVSEAIVDNQLVYPLGKAGTWLYNPYLTLFKIDSNLQTAVNQMIFIDYWGLAVTIYALIYKNIDYFRNTTDYKISFGKPREIDTRLDKLNITHYIKVSEILFPTGANHNYNDIHKVVEAFMDIYDTTVLRPLFDAVRDNNIEMVKLLIENGANVNATNDRGITPLFHAVRDNNIEMVKLLIEKGANVDAKERIGQNTPLFYAVHLKYLDIVTILIDGGADINIINNKKETSLFHAVNQKNIEIVKLLIEKGAILKCGC